MDHYIGLFFVLKSKNKYWSKYYVIFSLFFAFYFMQRYDKNIIEYDYQTNHLDNGNFLLPMPMHKLKLFYEKYFFTPFKTIQ